MVFPENRLIAALQNVRDVEALLDSPIELVFLRIGDVETLQASIRVLQNAGKRVFLQIDLIRGLSVEREAVAFVARQVKPDGIVTTHQRLIGPTQALGLPAILHNFIIDTGVLASTVGTVRALKPDAFYLMPGIMPRVVRELKDAIPVPIIAGGLFKHRDELTESRRAGAEAVVTGTADLWQEVVR